MPERGIRLNVKAQRRGQMRHLAVDSAEVFSMVGKPLPTSFEAGADIKYVSHVLGHSDISITARIYTNSQELHQAGEKPQASRSQDCRNGAPLVLMPAS
jgi:hypothetical protein